MRYFLVVLLAFALLNVPPLNRWEWLSGTAVRAAVALGLGMLLSGLHHLVYVEHYVRVMPPWVPAKSAAVYFSGVFRVALCAGLLTASLRGTAAIGALVLLCAVAPVNIRIAAAGVSEGQLIDADWFRWLRVAVHACWIGWCVWCLMMLRKG